MFLPGGVFRNNGEEEFLIAGQALRVFRPGGLSPWFGLLRRQPGPFQCVVSIAFGGEGRRHNRGLARKCFGEASCQRVQGPAAGVAM